MSERPDVHGILETILYADDLAAMETFYTDVIGLSSLWERTELGVGFRVSTTQVLLIFDPAVSSGSDRTVPSHGAKGAGHVAFRIRPETLDAWRQHLEANDIEIEQTHAWDDGGQSIYVRDPAGNSVEFIDRDIWPAGP